MKRIKWHKTRKQAEKHLNLLKESNLKADYYQVRHYKYGKRIKRFFVGSELEWINI